MNELVPWLTRARETTAQTEHRPLAFDVTRPQDADQLRVLLATNPGIVVFDTLAEQLAELVDTRHVSGKLTPGQRRVAVDAHLAGRDAASYGSWFYFPWLARLVHLLPREEFDELRLSRNRNKITAAEQLRLRQLDILVIGLSVGRATAITLALEGVCGRLRLADFDVLELSNLNRIRDSVFGLGLNKAVLASREIAEIDPYLDVEIHPEGVVPETLDALLGSPKPVDIVIEECDDLEMKLRVRERARALRLPVVMETSDRGMLDIERFDLEPERPIFHGLVGDLRAEELRGLDTYRKVPHILRIIGAETMSTRLAASMVDVETTLKTWPQLASAVALGGALNTEAVRRIALGGLRESGRYYADLDAMLARPTNLGPGVAPPTREAPQPTTTPTFELPAAPALDDDWRTWARFLVAHASLAPSGGNSQPWRFDAAPDHIRCLVDAARWPTMLDFDARASCLACGAAAANFQIAAAAAGRAWSIEWGAPGSDLAWRARAGEAIAPNPNQLRALVNRCTNRQLGTRSPLTADETAVLAASVSDVVVEFRADDPAMIELGEILAEGDRLRMLHPRLHRELMGELRWTRAEAETTGDGIDLETLELDATQRAACALSRQWPLMSTLRELETGGGLGRGSRNAAAGAAGFVLLRAVGAGRPAFLHGGFALTHLWLQAEAMGLAVRPMTALLYLCARANEGGEGLDDRDTRALHVLAQRVHTMFGPSPGVDLILLCLARAPRPSARSLRRPLDFVLRFHED